MARVLSGIKPTGELTLGNYIGALRNFSHFQENNEVYMFIADIHALTLPINPDYLRNNTYDIVAYYLAAGLNPDKCTIFKQSDIEEVGVLNAILINYIYMGELSRMTQYKGTVAKLNNKEIGVGIFSYPVLMAADLFLYDTEVCPVGDDQVQHVELAHDIARRFNARYKAEILTLPKVSITSAGRRIMSLQDPTKKMSKSEHESDKSCIYLADDEKTTTKKIMSAVTDLGSEVKYDLENKPGISNLLNIYCALTGLSVAEAESKFIGYNYGNFKKEVAAVVLAELTPFRNKFNKIRQDTAYLDKILSEGAIRARKIASPVLSRVKKAVGLM